MKTAKPQSAGSGSFSGPGRKRYFVNIVTQDQILEFQNEVSLKNTVPLLAPGKRENRLLILAPNVETIDAFQKRVLTQFQYNANVSADAVKLLESHFCEVPRSYSVSDALDARAETYLVVENIKPLGPNAKRKSPDLLEPSPGPESAAAPSARSEPSAKRLRRRANQAAKLASPEVSGETASDTTLLSPESNRSVKPHLAPDLAKDQAGSSSAGSGVPGEQSANAINPLFGRSRAENEHRVSLPSDTIPDIAKIKPPTQSSSDKHSAAKRKPDVGIEQAGEGRNQAASGALPLSSNTQKPKRARSVKATPAGGAAVSQPVAANVSQASQKTLPTPSDQVETAKSSSAKDSEVNDSQTSNLVSNDTGTERSQRSPVKPTDSQASKQQAHGIESTGKDSYEQNGQGDREATSPQHNQHDVETSDAETGASDSDASESSGSESDSGERQRRLSRRRVVAVTNGSQSEASPSGAYPERHATRDSNAHSNRKPVEKASATPQRPEVTQRPKAEIKSAEASTPETNEERLKDNQSQANAGPQRIPGLGSLADLANMRLPTVHELNHSAASASANAKGRVDEESSEEEEDNSTSNDSDDSSSSDEDSSDDDDTSTAGRKSRKKGLLGLLGNK